MSYIPNGNGVVENPRTYLEYDEEEAKDSGAEEEDDWDGASTDKEQDPDSDTGNSSFGDSEREKKSLRIILKVKGPHQLNGEPHNKPAEDVTMLDIGPLEKKTEVTGENGAMDVVAESEEQKA